MQRRIFGWVLTCLGGTKKRFSRGKVPVPVAKKELAPLFLVSDLVHRGCMCTGKEAESKAFDMFLDTYSGSFQILSGPPAIQNLSPNYILSSTPTIESQKGYWGSLQPFLGQMPPIYRFYRLGTCQACLPIPSRHFTMLTKFWSIDFLGINTIGIAEYVLLITVV